MYANQVGLFIKRIQTEASIRESEDALNKVLLANNEFIESNSDTIDYGKMTDSILSMTGAKCVVYNSFEDNGIEYKTEAISGFIEVRKILSSLLGYELINKKWKYDDIMSSRIKNNIITRFKSLNELTGIIPKPIAKLIDKTFNLGEVAIAKINIYGKDEGYFTLFFGGGNSIQNIRIVELYTLQAGLFIKRKQAEVALKNSEQMLQNILEHFPGDVFWKDKNAIFIGCNTSFAKSNGLENQTDIIQKTDFDLTQNQNEANYYRKDDYEVMNTGISKLHIEEMIQQKNGRVLWSDTNKIPIRDTVGKIIGLLGVVTDITERKLTQDALKESEQMLQYVLNNFPGLIYWKDTQSKYMGCNQSFAIIAGLDSSSEITHKTDYDLAWVESDANKFIVDDNEVMNTGKEMLHKVETLIQHNNKILWFDTSKIPLFNTKGSIIGVLGVSIDITERKQAEDELQKLNDELEARVKNRTNELEKSNSSLFLAEEKFRTVADFTYGWEYWISLKSEILYMSPSVERITGYSATEFINDPELLNEIIHPADKTHWENHINTRKNNINRKKHKEINFRILTKSGEVKWIGHVS
ncbi:MAG: PAS domain S-box protein, partial [Paludibacter sp.]